MKGGQGNNISCDAAQEICNRMRKTIVKGMGANKTTKGVLRASKAAAGIKTIIAGFDQEANIHKQTSKHSTVSADRDEMQMINDLRGLRPFRTVPNRHHAMLISKTCRSLS